MLGNEENFPATGKDSNDVGVRVSLRGSSHVLFCTKKLVEAFNFGVFVDEDYLSTILDHAMTRVAEKGKNGLVGIAFEEAA